MDGSTKDTFLQIRVSTEQKKRLRRDARRARLSVSEWVLAHALPAQGEQFQHIVRSIVEGHAERYRLADLNDFLAGLGRRQFDRAVAHAPSLPESPWLRNQIAAMVELAAHQKGTTAPRWTAEVEPLAVPHFGSTLVPLRLHLLTSSPPPFRRRNIFVDASVGDRV